MLALRDLLARVAPPAKASSKPSLLDLLGRAAPPAPPKVSSAPKVSAPQASAEPRRRGRPPKPLPARPQGDRLCRAQVQALLFEASPSGEEPRAPYAMRLAANAPYWKIPVAAEKVQGFHAVFGWAVRHEAKSEVAKKLVGAGKSGLVSLQRVPGTGRFELRVTESMLPTLRLALLETASIDSPTATRGEWTPEQLKEVARLLSPRRLHGLLDAAKGSTNRRRARRGARSVVDLSAHRQRTDSPRYHFYSGVWRERSDDPLLIEGHADEEAAKAYVETLRERYGRGHWLRVISREELTRARKGVEPRFWAKGLPAEVPEGADALTAARVVLGNLDWWMWGRPNPHLVEGVATSTEATWAARYAKDWNLGPDSIFVWRELTHFPDDFQWFGRAVKELAKHGFRYTFDSINPAVYVLIPDRA